jgi:hypothetical protein
MESTAIVVTSVEPEGMSKFTTTFLLFSPAAKLKGATVNLALLLISVTVSSLVLSTRFTTNEKDCSSVGK